MGTSKVHESSAIKEEEREYLIKANLAALRWHAQAPSLRQGDADHVVKIIDQIETLIDH